MEAPILAHSPWHEGEIALQKRLGVETRMDEIGRRVMRDHLIDQHREFYPLLPMVVLGSVDRDGDAWATLRAGEPGFLHAPDEKRLTVELPREPTDPAEAGMEDGAPLALLGIDLGTRRRNRLNGTLKRHARGFDLGVDQSFGNCPKYIQLRQARFVRDPSVPPSVPPVSSFGLNAAARALVAQADTFFVATYADLAGGRQIDVSHRGGHAGFVHVGEDGWLAIPDFVGNRFFNTLGNLAAHPRAGLLFVDFDSGDLLHVAVTAEIVWIGPEVAAFEGAERLMRFHVTHALRRPAALPLRWGDAQLSAHLAHTGQWNTGTRAATDGR